MSENYFYFYLETSGIINKKYRERHKIKKNRSTLACALFKLILRLLKNSLLKFTYVQIAHQNFYMKNCRKIYRLTRIIG